MIFFNNEPNYAENGLLKVSDLANFVRFLDKPDTPADELRAVTYIK